MQTNRSLLALLVLTVCILVPSEAQDWPQFLGPERNGTSPQKNILRTWPDTGPEVLWIVEVGRGYAGPAVKDGKVYFLDRDDQKGDIMRCFDLDNGQELWRFGYDAPGSVMFPGSRSVPTVDGNHVYSCGHNGNLYCFDINTQQPVWNKNVWTDFGSEELPIWAISQCPLVYGALLIVAYIAPDTPEAGVVAYDKLSGEVVWKTPPLGQETYASPTVVQIDGRDHIVMVTSSTNPVSRPNAEKVMGNVVGIEPLSGKILWEYSNWECHISVPPVVDAGNNKLLITGGYELGAVMIEVNRQPDGSYGTTELFRTEEFGDQTKPPLLIDGYFYAQYGTNRKRDGLTCMNMDGEIMGKTKRDPDFNKGSMILADGLILATDGATMLYLIDPDPSGFNPIASADILSSSGGSGPGRGGGFGTQNWAPIALTNGKLLVRDQSRLMCLRVAE
ncbi:MAG: outer membrane protein assembly factor BamB family protein [Bacteroidales bacterium]